MSMRFVTVDTMRQARCVAVGREEPETTGMSADDSAPAATSWNMRSGIRNAAKNASSWSVASGGSAFADDDEADPAEHARDEERARDDHPGPGQGPCGAHAPVPAPRRADGRRGRRAARRPGETCV